jgi:predicted membrane channel-forming protein YqfA (hemolysin III family)
VNHTRTRPAALLVLSLLLLVWEPVTFAMTASRLLPTLGYREPAVFAMLLLRVAVLGLGVAAGLAIWRLQPQGRRLGQAFFLLSSATAILVHGTAAFPSDLPPGTAGPVLAAVLAYNVAWFLYLTRSTAVRKILDV